MDIGLVSGLEANTEDLSTVSIRELLPFTEVFWQNYNIYCSSSFSVRVVVQIYIIIPSLLLNTSDTNENNLPKLILRIFDQVRS